MNTNELFNEFEQIYDKMLDETTDPEEIIYYTASRNRFKYLLKQLGCDLHNKKILDVGVSQFTYILMKLYSNLDLTALDFQHCEEKLKTYRIDYIYHNLERDEDELPKEDFDIVIFSEVIEHLATSPRIVLEKCYHMLKKNGIIIITTPNLLSFANRLKCVLGKSPLEIVRENLQNPGHFREYSMEELKKYVRDTGFTILKAEFPKYWNDINLLLQVYRLKGIKPLKLYFLYFPFVILRKIITMLFPTTDSAISIIAQKQGI